MKHISITIGKQRHWESFSDINNVYDGKKLTFEDYYAVEKLFIRAIHNFLDHLQLTPSDFKIIGLEDSRGQNIQKEFYKSIEHPRQKLCGGDNLIDEHFDSLIQLSLRDLLWLRMESNNGAYITFGHDLTCFYGAKDISLGDLEDLKEITQIELDEDPFE